MKETFDPFEKLLVGLVQNKIDFILVGGLACAFNGYVRPTEDVDILIKRNSANIKRLLKFLSSYEEGYGSELKEEDFSYEEGAIRVIESFPIDIFVVMSGKNFESLESEINYFSLDKIQIPYLSKKALINLKKNSLRDKDKMDVIQLSQID
ncbi:MAG: hypothetical protein H7A32_02050 [Deltaproteobacteria bacterium]|nr:hypothetical protein [Deltaproteobacteria bacterium]